jgi:cathepsin E
MDTSISYGTGGTSILPVTAGIIDSGTSLILLATDAYTAYKQATGAIEDANTGLLTITSDQFGALQSLFFTIYSETFEITANAQIFPRSLNSQIGGDSGKIYLIIGNLGSPTGSGMDFILGKAFLERFYVVFDTANAQIGKSILHGTIAFDY